MKIEIEEYRGWTIYFDTVGEKFYSVSNIEDLDKTTKSFASAKKAIDDYLKDNANFKPFQVEYWRWNDGPEKTVTVVGKTKDGRYMIENKEEEKSIVSKYDNDKYVFPNEANKEPITKIKELRRQVNELDKQASALSKTLIKKTLKDLE